MEAIDALRSAGLLQGIAEDDLRSAAPSLRRIPLSPSQRLWSEGEDARDVFVLAEGAILISRTSPSGQELIIKIYLEGEILGKIDAFAGGKRLSDATAASRSICFAMPIKTLHALVDRNPVLSRRLLRDLSESSRMQLEATTDIAFRDIKGRVARKLLDLATSNAVAGSNAQRIEIGLSLSQGQLAAMVAASRANVNRALAVLMADGLIEHVHGRFTVLDRERLEALTVGGTLTHAPQTI